MLTSRVLVDAVGVEVADVRCRADSPAWSAVEPVTGFGVVLVRSGLFRRRVDGAEWVVDVTLGYVQRPGSEQRVAHPVGGDRCTSITVDPSVVEDVDAHGPMVVDPRVDLAHRRLVARVRAGADRGELAERAVVLVGMVLSGRPPPHGRCHRRVVDEVRQAIHADPRLGLVGLARIAGLSPYHLSRVFRQTCGLTISGYRTRLRVRRALDRLAEGDHDLARLAVDVGFADQAHLTRAVRDETGSTPGRLRGLLG